MSKVLLKIICLVLFIGLLVATNIVYSFGYINDISFYFAFFIITFLLTPFLHPIFPKKFSTQVIGIFSMSFIFMALIFGMAYLNSFNENRFNYRFGYSLGPAQLVVQNSPTQFIFKTALSVLPFKAQYLVYTLEDSLRVMMINKIFKDKNQRNKICNTMKQYTCFKGIMIRAQSSSSFTSTGMILMFAQGAVLLKKTKDTSPTESIQNQISLLELMKFADKKIQSEASVEFLLPNFPMEEVQKIPLHTREKIDENTKNDKFLDSLPLESNLVEAYLLKRADKEIVTKFQEVLRTKFGPMKAKVETKIKTTNALSKEQVAIYQGRLRALDN